MNIFSQVDFIKISQIFISISVLVQSIEILFLTLNINKKSFHPLINSWSWQNLKADFTFLSPFIQKILRKCFDEYFLFLIVGQIFFCLGLIFFGNFLFLCGIFIFNFIVCLRFRGSFNGGSDSMTFVVLIGLGITELRSIHPIFLDLGALYIAFQSVMSYFIAGIVKFKNSQWRSGFALSIFTTCSAYELPIRFKSIGTNKKLMMVLSWLIILWESSTPLWLVSKPSALIFIMIALFFHLSNFIFFGLNRFVFAWIASYPAILHFV